MKTNFMPLRAMDLNENNEWVEVPLENVVPEWLYESINVEDEDEDEEMGFVFPYLQAEFKQWLMDERDLSEKYAETYLRDYESGYDKLHEEYGFDLYDTLEYCFTEAPETSDTEISKQDAPEYVQIYVDLMLEELDANEDAYTKAEVRALSTYHAFIVDISGSHDKKLIKEKSLQLPDEEEFIKWLETEYKIHYENARKIVSSIKRMDLILPSIVIEPMTFLDVLRALPAGSKRKNYIKLIEGYKKGIARKTKISEKTIINGLTNIRFYKLFLDSKG